MYFIRLVFWVSFFSIFYAYVAYPLLLIILSLFKKRPSNFSLPGDSLPAVSVLIAAHNEEKVIRRKIESVMLSDYNGPIQLITGSDNSTDLTDSIVTEMAANDKRIMLVPFEKRVGKVSVINKLVSIAVNPIVILTDANVMFENDTLYELVKNFKDDSVSLVDSNMINTGIKTDGISRQEKTYIKAEVYLKYCEGLLWGTMMGPFGGCYAMRKDSFRPVPSHFLVDDFYINMQVLLAGGRCINELKSKVYEDVSNDPYLEFRRKVRIAAGSFQNLIYYFTSIFHLNAISFCFFSHKVLRWLGPFFILAFYICTILLYDDPFFNWFKWVTTFILLTPFMDYFLRKVIRINFPLFRYPAHFVTSNTAIFFGFFRYLSGIRSGIWQPTKR